MKMVILNGRFVHEKPEESLPGTFFSVAPNADPSSGSLGSTKILYFNVFQCTKNWTLTSWGSSPPRCSSVLVFHWLSWIESWVFWLHRNPSSLQWEKFLGERMVLPFSVSETSSFYGSFFVLLGSGVCSLFIGFELSASLLVCLTLSNQ